MTDSIEQVKAEKKGKAKVETETGLSWPRLITEAALNYEASGDSEVKHCLVGNTKSGYYGVFPARVGRWQAQVSVLASKGANRVPCAPSIKYKV